MKDPIGRSLGKTASPHRANTTIARPFATAAKNHGGGRKTPALPKKAPPPTKPAPPGLRR